MGEVVDLFKKKSVAESLTIERKLTPELVREYKETILLVSQYQESLTIEDWKLIFIVLINFNRDLMVELGNLYDKE